METNIMNNILSEEDIKKFNDIVKLKSDLMSIIGIKNFIEFIKNTIDETDGISFRSEVARKYIDINEPIFKLKKDDFIVDKTRINDESYLSSITDIITQFITDTIIDKVSIFISYNIENNQKLKEAYEKLSEDVKNITFINTYSIRISPADNIIYLKYVI